MSDERRQNSTVNLQELERQLREAARARQRAQASADTLTGVQTERPPVPVAQNPSPQPNPAAYQPGLPLSAPPPQAAQPAPATSFRPLSQPQATAVPQPSMPQASPYFGSQASAAPAPRDPVPTYAPAQTTAYEPRRTDYADDLDDEVDIVKSDRMGDIYPPVEAETVGQDQFYSAAAYEEPAQNAYDRFTEDQFPRIEQEERSGGAARFVIWIAIIAVLGGGIYLAFPLLQGMFMPSSQTAKAPALIKADPAPVKVEPEAQPQDNANAPKDIFTKHANEDPKAAQITAPAEQPTDINAAIKAGNAAQGAGAKPATVPLVPGTGEPRVVKTVTVRADGTIIPEKSDPTLAAKTVAQGPKVIKMPQPVAPATPAATPSEPSLPQNPVAQSPEFVLDGAIPLPPERAGQNGADASQPSEPVATPAQPAPEPQATAPAAPASAPAPAPTVAGKEFFAQFGAPETEAKGNELKAQVEKQYAAALAGSTVVVIKGDNNGRAVYRVRAIGLSREEAGAVCQQVTAANGACFVSKSN